MTFTRGGVVHVVPALFGDSDGIVGGAERYVFELAREMATVAPTTLVTFGRTNREEQSGSLRIVVLGNARYVRGQRTNPIAWQLAPRVAKADVVHCHQQHVVASTCAALIGRLTGARVACTELGGGGWDLSAYVSTDRLYHLHLHISEYSRRIAGHTAMQNAHVIWGGVDAERFAPARRVTDDPAVTFVGRLLPHKGVDTLLQALPGGVRANIIGPAYDARYLAHLESLAVGKQVRFHHHCDDAALVEAYQQARCIVLPSVYDDMYGNHTDVPELLGQTLLEGMACGVPGICTDVASLPEVVEHGVTGFVVPPGDVSAMRSRIEWLIEHPGEAARLGSAGRARVLGRFTWPAVVRHCLELYGTCAS